MSAERGYVNAVCLRCLKDSKPLRDLPQLVVYGCYNRFTLWIHPRFSALTG